MCSCVVLLLNAPVRCRHLKALRVVAVVAASHTHRLHVCSSNTFTVAAPEADESATFVPKQRILVRLNPAANSVETRQRVLNGLRSTVTSDLMRIEDTAECVPHALVSPVKAVPSPMCGVVLTVLAVRHRLLESADLTNLALQYVTRHVPMHIPLALTGRCVSVPAECFSMQLPLCV